MGGCRFRLLLTRAMDRRVDVTAAVDFLQIIEDNSSSTGIVAKVVA